MLISEYEFCKIIALDHGIDLYKKVILKFNSFPKKNGKKSINAPYDSVIVKDGIEYPYMNGQRRNNDKLNDFDYIYYFKVKSLIEIMKECDLDLKSNKCKISEGNGWCSDGNEYHYKNFKCKI